MWPFNTGDCLIDVTAWAGLTSEYITCVCVKSLIGTRLLLKTW